MTKIDVTLDNRARLKAAEWAVWDADHKVKDRAHHVMDIVWVNPETLEIYIDIAAVHQYDCWHFLKEADNRQLFARSLEAIESDLLAERFANVQMWEIVPIREIIRGYGTHDLQSTNLPCETLNMFFHWLEGQGRKPDEVYEELWQKCGIALLSPSEWAAAEKYDEYEWDDEDDVEQDIEVLDHASEDEQMVTFLRNHPIYSDVVARIERDSYHMAVRLAMELIVTVYDHDPEHDHTSYDHD